MMNQRRRQAKKEDYFGNWESTGECVEALRVQTDYNKKA
jgi:hypothetical protein